jgi:hypothetical protein
LGEALHEIRVASLLLLSVFALLGMQALRSWLSAGTVCTPSLDVLVLGFISVVSGEPRRAVEPLVLRASAATL